MEEALIRCASSHRIEERIYWALSTLHLQGKAGESALSRAVYVRFYSNKIKDKTRKPGRAYLQAN